jgi:hypothetical protein
MPSIRTLARWVGVLAGLATPTAWAQAPVAWQVIAGESSQVAAPGLPAGSSRNITNVVVGDTGSARIGLQLTSPTAQSGYWAFRGGTWQRLTQLASSGSLGPGRGGAEASHVFIDVLNGWNSTGPDGQRLFLGRAGDPANLIAASYGLWRWDGTRNIEVVRGASDQILGPGLGSGWVFANNSLVGNALLLDGGQAVIVGEVTSPTGATSVLVARHVPGVGNVPCLRGGATDPGLSPGVSPGDTFLNVTSGVARFSSTRSGLVRARLGFNGGSRTGIFEVCNGAPRALALNDDTGLRGPDVGIAGAYFNDFGFDPALPAAGNAFVFWADWRSASTATRTALFRNDTSGNRGIAYNEPSGFFGPNWLGATWRTFSTGSLSVNGDYAAFVASVDTPDGGIPTGLWRLRAGERPQLVALIGLIGAYEPEPGRTWRSFDALATMANGDLVLDATTNPNAVRDLWLLRAGQPPRRILSLGQSLAIPTATGTVQAAITSLSVPGGGARFAGGIDDWAAADGTLVLTPSVATYGEVVITTRLDVPDPDVVFASGFE